MTHTRALDYSVNGRWAVAPDSPNEADGSCYHVQPDVATNTIATSTSRSPCRRRPPPCGRIGASGTARWNNPHSSSGTKRSSSYKVSVSPAGRHFLRALRVRPGCLQLHRVATADRDQPDRTGALRPARATVPGNAAAGTSADLPCLPGPLLVLDTLFGDRARARRRHLPRPTAAHGSQYHMSLLRRMMQRRSTGG